MQKVLILLCSTRKKNKLSRYYSFPLLLVAAPSPPSLSSPSPILCLFSLFLSISLAFSLFQHTAGQHLVDCINVRCYIVTNVYILYTQIYQWRLTRFGNTNDPSTLWTNLVFPVPGVQCSEDQP